MGAESSQGVAKVSQASGWSSPVVVALVGATISAASLIFSNCHQTSSRLEQQKMEHNSRLVMEVVTGDLEQTQENLRFLLEAGLLADEDGRLQRAIDRGLSLQLEGVAAVGFRHYDGEIEAIYYQIIETLGLRSRLNVLRPNSWIGPAAAWIQGQLNYNPQWFYGWVMAGDTTSIAVTLASQMGHQQLGHVAADDSFSHDQILESHAWAGFAAHRLGITQEQLSQYFARGPFQSRGPSREQLAQAALRGWALSAIGRPISEVVRDSP